MLDARSEGLVARPHDSQSDRRLARNPSFRRDEEPYLWRELRGKAVKLEGRHETDYPGRDGFRRFGKTVMGANFAVGELIEAASWLGEEALVAEALEIDARDSGAFEVPRTRNPPGAGDGERSFSMILGLDHGFCCYLAESVAKYRAFATYFPK
jgi:hypothetical protein